MEIQEKAKRLVKYINQISDFKIINEIDGNYNHMGAIITDAILQSGLNYESVVRPRVNNIIKKYPEARTTSEFQEIINKYGLKKILNWNDDEKPNRIKNVTIFFSEEKIERQLDLLTWLQNQSFQQETVFFLLYNL